MSKKKYKHCGVKSLWRAFDDDKACGPYGIRLQRYEVKRYTPKGFVILVEGEEKRTFLRNSYRVFAHPTKELAVSALAFRRCSEYRRLEYKITNYRGAWDYDYDYGYHGETMEDLRNRLAHVIRTLRRLDRVLGAGFLGCDGLVQKDIFSTDACIMYELVAESSGMRALVRG